MDLRLRDHWIFDMDGTLTLAAHDFDEIKRILGLRSDQRILEHISALPEAEAAPLWEKLHAWELGIAKRSEPDPHALELLAALRARGARVGILTRNTLHHAQVTIEAAGLGGHFDVENIVTRDHGPAKPEPHGILMLLERWGARKESAVMVGDYLFDLQAGRAAGVTTVHYDVAGEFPWKEHADHCVKSLAELRALAIGPPSALDQKV